MVHVFYARPTNGRTMKKKYEDGAPNIRRSVFGLLNISNEIECLSIAFATIQTYKMIV